MSRIILNTRPAHQATPLTELLESAGHTVYPFPLLDIEPLYFKTPDLSKFHILIFLSSNAVHHFFASCTGHLDSTKTIIAIGPATQKALENAGVSASLLPTYFSSEGILNLACLKHPVDQNILIVSGKDPKSLLSIALKKRGAFIQTVFCYERVCKKHEMQKTFPKLKAENIDTIIVTSLANLNCLTAQFKSHEQLSWLQKKTLCVINADLKSKAITLGFTNVIQANDATDEAIATALHQPYS